VGQPDPAYDLPVRLWICAKFSGDGDVHIERGRTDASGPGNIEGGGIEAGIHGLDNIDCHIYIPERENTMSIEPMVALVIALIGLAVYAVSSNGKAQALGLDCFWVGLLAFLLTWGGRMPR